MRPLTPRRPGAAPGAAAPLVALTAVVAVVLLAGLLIAFGVIDLSRLMSREPSTEGLVAVPTPAAPIPAYARVRRDHLWDRANNRLAVIYLPPTAVTKEMLVNISDILGRVVDHAKEPGYVFTEADFLPRGTREGMVAGIPPGKRAVRIGADRVDGLYGLNTGDRFDILATIPIDSSRGAQMFNFSGPYSQEVALEARLSNWDKQATVRVIVQNAVIVEPMNTRAVPTYQSSLTEGAATRTRPVQEAVIAVNPEEVAPLTEAMAVEARLTTIPRSGRPEDPVDSKTPDRRPFNPLVTPGGAIGAAEVQAPGDEPDGFAVVETIMGQRRSLTAVPRP